MSSESGSDHESETSPKKTATKRNATDGASTSTSTQGICICYTTILQLFITLVLNLSLYREEEKIFNDQSKTNGNLW